MINSQIGFFATNYTSSEPIIWDTDALAYISAVETADGQTLEDNLKVGINAFVTELKNESLWSNIDVISPMCGARTFNGGLINLKGSSNMTSYNMVSGDYDRKNGFKGNGTDSYIDTGGTYLYTRTTTPSCGISQTVLPTTGIRALIGLFTIAHVVFANNSGDTFFRLRSNNAYTRSGFAGLGYYGGARPSTNVVEYRADGTTTTVDPNTPTSSSYTDSVLTHRRYNGSYSDASLRGFHWGDDYIDLVKMETAWSNFFTYVDAL